MGCPPSPKCRVWMDVKALFRWRCFRKKSIGFQLLRSYRICACVVRTFIVGKVKNTELAAAGGSVICTSTFLQPSSSSSLMVYVHTRLKTAEELDTTTG